MICHPLISSAEEKMEATFGPTFSAVASGSKGNNQTFFVAALLNITLVPLLSRSWES